MIELNLIDKNITRDIKSKYFAHYKIKEENQKRNRNDPFERTFSKNYEELSKNDWELHKQLIKEGRNPNEIAKIIRNDEIEKLQEISSQTNFDFNQTIEPSLYERCDFINHSNVTLIEYAAFFGSVKCFKYLLINNAKLENTGKYAVAGGNEEIIHLCEQNHSSFEGAYETAIRFHRNDIFRYLYDNEVGGKILKRPTIFDDLGNIMISGNTILADLGCLCINKGSFQIFSFLVGIGMKINDSIINESLKNHNLYLIQYFLQNSYNVNNILFKVMEFGNIEYVEYILKQKYIYINAKNFELFYLIFEFVI